LLKCCEQRLVFDATAFATRSNLLDLGGKACYPYLKSISFMYFRLAHEAFI